MKAPTIAVFQADLWHENCANSQTDKQTETHHETQRGHVWWQRARKHIAICLKADDVLATTQQCAKAARELIVAHIQTLYHAFTHTWGAKVRCNMLHTLKFLLLIHDNEWTLQPSLKLLTETHDATIDE